MYNVDVRGIVLLCVFAFVSAYRAVGQIPGADTDDIESLITEWNSAYNNKNIHGFEKLYAGRLSLNGSEVSKQAAVREKQQFFRSNPEFRQRIVTEITYQAETKGTIRARFTKEVFQRSQWVKRRSTLLLRRSGGRYVIVGEDDQVRRAVPAQPSENPADDRISLSEPAPSPTDTVDSLSDSDTMPALPSMEHPDSLDDHQWAGAEPNGDSIYTRPALSQISVLFSDPAAFGTVTIPRGYLYILVGLLSLGGLLIFVADSMRTSRRRRRVQGPSSHEGAEHVVRDFRVQAAFESFVVTLFDPLYFKPFRPKAEYVFEGKAVESGKGPDLILDYRQKETHMRFAITCQYYQHPAKNEVQLLSGERQDLIRKFASERQIDAYYVLGFGGKPDDPRELFFIPAADVNSEYMTRSQLLAYSKSGMFYFNRKVGRIQ